MFEIYDQKLYFIFCLISYYYLGEGGGLKSVLNGLWLGDY